MKRGFEFIVPCSNKKDNKSELMVSLSEERKLQIIKLLSAASIALLLTSSKLYAIPLSLYTL